MFALESLALRNRQTDVPYLPMTQCFNEVWLKISPAMVESLPCLAPQSSLLEELKRRSAFAMFPLHLFSPTYHLSVIAQPALFLEEVI